MNKRVLLAEDDEAFRSSLKDCLEEEGYEVRVAATGRCAQNLVEIGASDFIAKPFRREEFLKAVQTCCNGVIGALEREEKLSADNFSRLAIDNFVSGSRIQHDIFIRLSDRKFVKIAHHGEDLPIDQIRAYKSKRIRYLYIRKSDYRKYVGFNLSLSQALKSSTTVSKAKKLVFLKQTNETILDHLYTDNVDRETFDDAKAMVETTVAVACDHQDIFDMLQMLNAQMDFVYAHSLGVSLHSVMLAREVSWSSPANLFKVALGGLLHDIGKKEIGREILLKPRKDLTPEEIKLVESHPVRGMRLLAQNHSISEDVLQIVLQHHETRLMRNRIHPMARLIAVADEFCHHVLHGPNQPELPPVEAIQRMISLHSDALDPEPLKALMRLFHVSIPNGL